MLLTGVTINNPTVFITINDMRYKIFLYVFSLNLVKAGNAIYL